jgi:hypothetical protein
MRRSTFYGLTLATTFELPDVEPVAAGEADITIERGSVDCEGLTPDARDRRLRAGPDEILIHWPQVGGFRISKGRRIVVQADPGVSDAVIGLYLLGAALGLLLHQRGLTVLHAGAVSIDGCAVALIGGKGWGKSTLTAALLARGHKLLSDDIAAIRREGAIPTVLPGIPSIKLWPDSIEAIGRNPEAYERLYPEVEKRTMRLSEEFCPTPLPLRAIVCLGGGDGMSIEPLAKFEALTRLMPHWYGARYGLPVIKSIGAGSQLTQCGDLVNRTHCALLRRPEGLNWIAEAAEMVETHVAHLQASDGG